MPKVSVIIPAYNAMSYLPDTVKSVINQTFTDFEVLIIDDGSTDGTIDWVSQLKDPRIRLISQENQGSSASRNLGITKAKGEYIALLDADDIWEATKLEKQVRYLEEHPSVGLVDTWTVLIDRQGQSMARVVISYAEGDDVWKQLVQFKTVCCCDSTPLIRRSCFETVGLFDRELPFLEDLDMWIRLASHYDFGVIKEPLVQYRQHPGSKSTHCQETLAAFRTTVEKAFESVPGELLPLRERGYANVYLYLAWKAINNQDYHQALHFHRHAIAHYPLLIFSWNFIRQRVALLLLEQGSPEIYDKAKAIFQALRRAVSRVTRRSGLVGW